MLFGLLLKFKISTHGQIPRPPVESVWLYASFASHILGHCVKIWRHPLTGIYNNVLHVRSSSNIFHVLPTTVARSSSGGVAVFGWRRVCIFAYRPNGRARQKGVYSKRLARWQYIYGIAPYTRTDSIVGSMNLMSTTALFLIIDQPQTLIGVIQWSWKQ